MCVIAFETKFTAVKHPGFLVSCLNFLIFFLYTLKDGLDQVYYYYYYYYYYYCCCCCCCCNWPLGC
jgi:hypothetical protein